MDKLEIAMYRLRPIQKVILVKLAKIMDTIRHWKAFIALVQVPVHCCCKKN